MKNGIYSLSFRSDGKNFGSGILVIDDNLANGGDITYTYNGVVSENRLILSLKKHNLDVHSFFGNSGLLKINLNFHEDSQGYMLSGNVENMQSIPLLVQAKKIGELAHE
ncbi:GrlR family regulatory protein [uncultured Acinetobacter sp.]|uniref:GrlR family regulatory protein n=1 Tax=uncultured Acinetobacter sp. TaxID=165433 RepID=UPI00258DFEC6|nr:GrlR family regulatory protein [uncultured Acinetobacter sp.]